MMEPEGLKLKLCWVHICMLHCKIKGLIWGNEHFFLQWAIPFVQVLNNLRGKLFTKGEMLPFHVTIPDSQLYSQQAWHNSQDKLILCTK